MKIKLELEINDCRQCPLHQADPKFSCEWGCVYDGKEDKILMNKKRELLLPCQWRKCPLEVKE